MVRKGLYVFTNQRPPGCYRINRTSHGVRYVNYIRWSRAPQELGTTGMTLHLSPRRLEAVMSIAQQLNALLDTDDHQLRVDTLEGETEVLELLDQLVCSVMADERLVEQGQKRLARIEHRAEQRRDLILRMLMALEISAPLERPLYTASVGYSTKLQIIDASKIPAGLMTSRPDLNAIKRVMTGGNSVEGATLSNPQPHLRIGTQ